MLSEDGAFNKFPERQNPSVGKESASPHHDRTMELGKGDAVLIVSVGFLNKCFSVFVSVPLVIWKSSEMFGYHNLAVFLFLMWESELTDIITPNSESPTLLW